MGPGLQPRFGAVSSLLLTLVVVCWPPPGWTGNELVREILEELVEIPTTLTSGRIPEAAGAMDGLFVRNAGIPTYGMSALAEDPGGWRIHGANERVCVQAYNDSVEFW